MLTRNILIAGLIASVSACSIQPIDGGYEDSNYENEQQDDSGASSKIAKMKKVSMGDPRIAKELGTFSNKTIKPETRMHYKRAVPSTTGLAYAPVTIADKNISLIKALTKPFKNVNVVTNDSSVDLSLKLKLFADNMQFEQYLEHIAKLSGYDIDYSKSIITITGRITRVINISPISDNKDAIDSMTQMVQGLINLDHKGASVSVIDNNSKLIISGLPSEVREAEATIDGIVLDSMRQVLIGLNIFSKTHGSSEELFVAQSIIRNGKQSVMTSKKRFMVPAVIDGEDNYTEVVMGISFNAKARIGDNNQVVVEINPTVDSIESKSGKTVLNVNEIEDIKQSVQGFKTEVVINSGSSLEIGTGMSAMLHNGIRIPAETDKSAKTLIFNKAASNRSMKEFKVSLSAMMVEAK